MTGNDLIALAQWYPVCKRLRETLDWASCKEIKQILYRQVLYQQGKYEVVIEYREHGKSYWVYIPVKEDDTEGEK